MLEHPFYDSPAPIAIAHQGGDLAGMARLNTMPAFELAVAAGVKYIETDIVASADGKAVAYHGSRSQRQKRATGLPTRREIESLTYGEMQRISFGGAKIPLLEEALDAFPDTNFFIDPKTKSSVKPLAEVINRLKVHDRVAVGAFDDRRTRAVAEHVSKPIITTMGVLGSVALFGASRGVPLLTESAEHIRASQVAVHHNLTDPRFVEKAHDLGYRVYFWTVNSEAAIRRSLDSGADGVMSDHVLLMQSVVSEYHQTD